jgi:glycosyltransferase involved in cell wall biosynthesis
MNRPDLRATQLKPSVVVAQHGSRHQYAIARIFEDAGLLTALFTDSSAHSLVGRIAQAAQVFGYKKANRLAARRVTGVPPSKIFSSDIGLYKALGTRYLRPDDEPVRRWCSTLSRTMETWWHGIESPSHLYNMYAENLDFLRFIKRTTSVRILVDVYASPFAGDIFDEQAAILGIAVPQSGTQALPLAAVHEAFSLADVLICPSEYIVQCVSTLDANFAQKCVVCAYGAILPAETKTNDPVPGRMLWMGGDWVRKGLHTLAEAASLLAERHPAIEFRIAGLDHIPSEIRRGGKLKALGKLNRSQILEEFAMADAFVLPTYSEGLASALIEALASGCPVITTPQSGLNQSIDGHCGTMVEAGNSEQLSFAVEQLYLDRAMRNRMAGEAKLVSESYTMASWSARLIDIITEDTRKIQMNSRVAPSNCPTKSDCTPVSGRDSNCA